MAKVERVFRKGDRVNYAYSPAGAVRLRGDGWVEELPAPPVEEEPDAQEPEPSPSQEPEPVNEQRFAKPESKSKDKGGDE